MRKCVGSLIRRRLVHLEQATIRATTPRRHSRCSGGGRRALCDTPGSLAALPADPAAIEDLLATIESHVELVIADDAALARGRALHDFDVLTLDSRSWAAISAIVCGASPALALPPIGTLNLPGG